MSEEREKVCVFIPEECYVHCDDDDVEHTNYDLGSEGWDCSECGGTMMGGYDCGWFDTETGRPRFSYCPYCGTKVDIEGTMLLATSEVDDDD